MPVFDRRDRLPEIRDTPSDWAPTRSKKLPGVSFRLANDGPDVGWRLDAQAARLTSNNYSGQAANDNQDWPLQKLLRTEGNEHCLTLSQRYRDLHDTATRPCQLVGREAQDLYVAHNEDEDGRDKGHKVVTGRKANIDTPSRRAIIASDECKKLAAPVPKKWNGDWPLLAAIDAKRELAVMRAKLAYVPSILDGFEWAVIDGLTLEAIGKRLGAGSKGAKGEARARIFDGFGIVDRYWQVKRRASA